MARRSPGGVLERETSRGLVYALRFRADVERDGRRVRERFYVTLGSDSEGWTREAAEDELAKVRSEIRNGTWRPVSRQAPVVREARTEPDFHTFASEWFAGREAEGLAAKTLVDLRGSLTNHLLPFFQNHRLSEITVQEVDRYTTAKTRERAEIERRRAEAVARGERFGERGLSNGSINHTLRHLAQVLETALEYARDEGWPITSNPAAGKRRRLKASRPSRPWVEPEQLMALLDAAKTDDGKAGVGRVLFGILAGTGVRIGEALSLKWADVDLGTGTLYVRESKTEKGVRRVDLSPALREELTLWRADTRYAGRSDFVVCTSAGRRHHPSNLRRDVLAPAVERANAKLAEADIAPVPDVTFHSFRRTYATVQRFLEPTDYVADQLGHEDSRFTDRVYRQTPRNRRDRLAPAHREAFDRAIEWARIGVPDRALAGTEEPLTVAALRA